MDPLAIDLFCGLGGWTEGLLAEGYRVIGFDIEQHVYGDAKYPGQLVIQDVLTLNGSQFKDAALIVASPPCQAYSYRAMPWKRAKALPPPDNTLFESCFRIQREACEAAGHHIPMVVENVCGAQKWVGKARWHFGSFYLWGDVPAALRPVVTNRRMKFPAHCGPRMWSEREYVRLDDGNASAFHHEGKAIKNNGGSDAKRKGGTETGRLSRSGSKSSARKAASAHIAKIPRPLSTWIAKCYYPKVEFSNEENCCREGGEVRTLVGDSGGLGGDRVASEI